MPNVSHETLGNRLLQFDRDTLMQMLLTGRQDLNPEETEWILNALEAARDRVLDQSQETWNQLQSEAGEFRQRVESYLRETEPAQLTFESIQQALQTLLKTPQAGLLALQTSLGQLDRAQLEQILDQRTDLDQQQVNQVSNQFETIRDTFLHTSSQLSEQAKQQYEQLTDQIGQYLRDTNLEELNPEGIQRDLSKLLNDPQAGGAALRNRLSQIDRETLLKLLSQRTDLDETQVSQIIDQVQDAIRKIIHSPHQFAARTRDQIRDFQTNLANYLRHTDREELNPDGIQRDLQLLLKHPQAGMEQLGDRFAQFDRETLRALLIQREDMTEEDVDQILNQIESARDQIIKQTQRAQAQVKTTVDDWNERLRQYLDSLEQPELNYEGIQRDVRKLFDDPSAGLEAFRHRLSQFDRETLVALLSSRPDISPEQADQIIRQIEAARDNALQKAERLQAEAEQRITDLKQNAKAQMEEAQKTVATAAWWLFSTAITSVVTAAIAGSLASGGLWFLS
jgi:predicted transcriptional regulator